MASGAGKIYFILYLAVILELLLVIVDRDDAEEGLKRKNEEVAKAFIQLLSMSDKPGASAKQDVQKYYVDAEDNGSFNIKDLSQIMITLTSVSDTSVLATYPKITKISYIHTRGEEALAPKEDAEIIERLKSSKDSLDINIVQFEYFRMSKNGFLNVPLKNVALKNTGYYKMDFAAKLHKITFEPSKENCKRIRFGDLTVEFDILKNYTSAEDLDKDLNYITNSVYIAIMDNTIPAPKEPPKVQIHTQ
jgi:hypothetical protein